MNSKPIKKTDDDAKALIIEALDGKVTGGFDIDSIYYIKEKYYVLEFLKCDTVRPNNSHPKRYWHLNKQKFISLWHLTQTLGGSLYLINYEDSREQFKVIKVLALDDTGILKEEIRECSFAQFKEWFQRLNQHSIN